MDREKTLSWFFFFLRQNYELFVTSKIRLTKDLPQLCSNDNKKERTSSSFEFLYSTDFVALSFHESKENKKYSIALPTNDVILRSPS